MLTVAHSCKAVLVPSQRLCCCRIRWRVCYAATPPSTPSPSRGLPSEHPSPYGTPSPLRGLPSACLPFFIRDGCLPTSHWPNPKLNRCCHAMAAATQWEVSLTFTGCLHCVLVAARTIGCLRAAWHNTMACALKVPACPRHTRTHPHTRAM